MPNFIQKFFTHYHVWGRDYKSNYTEELCVKTVELRYKDSKQKVKDMRRNKG